MQHPANSLETLFQKTGDYLETRIKLIKLQFIDKTSELISSVTASLSILFLAVLSIFILSIGLALWIGELLGKTYYGFFIVGGFYIVLALVALLFKKQLFTRPVGNLFIDKVLN